MLHNSIWGGDLFGGIIPRGDGTASNSKTSERCFVGYYKLQSHPHH